MSLYPSLEDMKVHQIQQAQEQTVQQMRSQPPKLVRRLSELSDQDQNSFSSEGPWSSIYASLMDDYMGLHLEPPSGPIQQQHSSPAAYSSPSDENAVATRSDTSVSLVSGGSSQMIAPLSGADIGLRRANVTHGIREVVLCKDQDRKVGLRLKSVNKGVFVQFVHAGSPAALAGLRFGDQILQVNGANVAGFSSEKAMDLFKKAAPQRIVLAVRDRPFERTITLHKDSGGHIGFQYKNGNINAIEKDSSAARNGLLIDHQVLEINGQNCVGLKDSEIGDIVKSVDQIVTVTIMPFETYEHIMKNIGEGLVRRMMDHSIPDV